MESPQAAQIRIDREIEQDALNELLEKDARLPILLIELRRNKITPVEFSTEFDALLEDQIQVAQERRYEENERAKVQGNDHDYS